MKTRTLLLTFDALLPSSSHCCIDDGKGIPFSLIIGYGAAAAAAASASLVKEMELHVSPTAARNDCAAGAYIRRPFTLLPSKTRFVYLLVRSLVCGLGYNRSWRYIFFFFFFIFFRGPRDI
jgi:hypothetical protein